MPFASSQLAVVLLTLGDGFSVIYPLAPAATGTPESAEMLGLMVSGVKQLLTITDGLLLAVVLSVILFNPNKTGQRLQRNLAPMSNN